MTSDGVLGGSVGIIANKAGTRALTVTTHGAVVGLLANGIVAENYGTDLSVVANGAVGGGMTGIIARNMGTGALSITANGNVSGESLVGKDGIFASNGRASQKGLTITIADGVEVRGQQYGISASNFGLGDLLINSNGDVIGTDDDHSTRGIGGIGIGAVNFGAGALMIVSNGNVTGMIRDGIFARNYIDNPDSRPTDLTVTTGTDAKTQGRYAGINAANSGTGALRITAHGDVTGTYSHAIYAYNSDAGTDLYVTTGSGTAVSGITGVMSRNAGKGALRIMVGGNVNGTGSDGIFAGNAISSLEGLIVAANDETTIMGSQRGIHALNYGAGALAIAANGAVVGTGYQGIYARNSGYSSYGLTITTGAQSRVTGASDGIFASNRGAGKLEIAVDGDVVGTGAQGARVKEAVGILADRSVIGDPREEIEAASIHRPIKRPKERNIPGFYNVHMYDIIQKILI